jgi:hypothetical protein
MTIVALKDSDFVQPKWIEGYNYRNFKQSTEAVNKDSSRLIGSYTGKALNQDCKRNLTVVSLRSRSDQRVTAKAGRRDLLENEFHNLVILWREETADLSSPIKMYAHPAYQRIMAMGAEGLPFVLNELQRQTDHWFHALRYMAGKNISEGITDPEEAKDAWLTWGYKNNHI